ncbi:beta-lactamase family protein [Roseomonas hellenica]|uniref:Beta-lactamase family protein n=1 Tax=Plastoroseomonas hellenica TaxID=2687306 RepID=A0ABS5ETF9_9PROT|nr:serine hydrolase domain-containing protein [Plastoroseomonas hellenica]MBR0663573.1 beta-lactamase family protein [Plastoroseomonas hellenica]
MATIAFVDPPLPTAEPSSLGFSAPRLARLGAALNREVEAGRLPGAVIAIARHGRLVHAEAVGQLDPATGSAMRADAIFAIASMTKPVTGATALSLMQEGRLLPSDPVADWLPAFARMRVGVESQAMLSGTGPLETRPAAAVMTVQDAMRHTTGFVYGGPGRGSTAVHAAYPGGSGWLQEKTTSEQAEALLAGLPLRHEPGTVWEYGFSTDVLGLVVERAAGARLGDAMRERILAPLGMTETGQVVTEARLARMAKPFAQDPLGGGAQSVPVFTTQAAMDPGGTGLTSTASDYLRFAQMLLDRGRWGKEQVLAPRIVDWMVSDHLGDGIRNTLGSFDASLAGYGFGLTVAVRTRPGVAGLLGNPGLFTWSGVYGTNFWVDPAAGLAVVFMAQAPGELRKRYRRLVNMLVYQALEE